MFDPNSYGNISDRIDFEIMKDDKELNRQMGRWEDGDDDDDEMEFEEEKQPEEDSSSDEEDQDSSQDSYVSSEE